MDKNRENSNISVYHTVRDDIDLQAGAKPMVVNRQERIKTRSGRVRMISENNLVLKPGSRMKSVAVRNKFVKGCLSIRNCIKKVLDTTVTVETKARTPFFLSGPRFNFGIYRHLKMATESWFDVM